MADVASDLGRLRAELAGIAATADCLEQRAAAVLQVLGGVLPFDAAWLAVRDPERRWHTPLATTGPADPLRRYFQTPGADAEVELLGLNRLRPPMLTTEIPIPLPEVHAWADHLLPAGFRGGMAAGLFASTGRHVGFLSLLAEDPSRPGPADRTVVAALGTVIADDLDRTRHMAETARIVAGATAGVLLTSSGGTLPLPGLPDHRLLVPGYRVLVTAADELAVAGPHVSFLAPVDGPDGVRLVRVTALDFTAPALDHLSAAVLLSAPGDLRGLTLLQLGVLGLLVEGVSRVPAVAAALGVEEHTAADALDAVLVAMWAADLTAATVGAVRTGLRIPPRLAGPHLGDDQQAGW